MKVNLISLLLVLLCQYILPIHEISNHEEDTQRIVFRIKKNPEKNQEHISKHTDSSEHDAEKITWGTGEDDDAFFLQDNEFLKFLESCNCSIQ